MENIEEIVERRNKIQFRAEDDPTVAQETWARLGVVNRHIDRIYSGQLDLSAVEQEIDDCLARVDYWLTAQKL